MSLVNQSIIKHKMGLLNLAEELQNVFQACRVMGVSRDTFYRVKEAKETGGMEALLHKDRPRANRCLYVCLPRPSAPRERSLR
jgi:hypothetical protein